MSLLSRIASKNQRIVRRGLVLYVDAGRVASYPGSGTTWTDLSGSGGNGSFVHNPPSYSISYSNNNGGYLSFVSVGGIANDMYRISVSKNYTLTAATFMVWVRRTANTPWGGLLFSRGNGGDTTGMGFYQDWNRLGYHWNGMPASYIFSNGPTVPLNAWSMCVFTVSNTQAIGYVGSSSGISISPANTLTHPSSNLNNLSIGADTEMSGPKRILIGDISLAAMYDRVLSFSEIQKNFNVFRKRYGI